MFQVGYLSYQCHSPRADLCVLKFGGKSTGFGGKVQPAFVLSTLLGPLRRTQIYHVTITGISFKASKAIASFCASGPIGLRDPCVIRLSQQGDMSTSGLPCKIVKANHPPCLNLLNKWSLEEGIKLALIAKLGPFRTTQFSLIPVPVNCKSYP